MRTKYRLDSKSMALPVRVGGIKNGGRYNI